MLVSRPHAASLPDLGGLRSRPAVRRLEASTTRRVGNPRSRSIEATCEFLASAWMGRVRGDDSGPLLIVLAV